MNDTEFSHYGVLGMKWGVRKAGFRKGGNKKKRKVNKISNENSKGDLTVEQTDKLLKNWKEYGKQIKFGRHLAQDVVLTKKERAKEKAARISIRAAFGIGAGLLGGGSTLAVAAGLAVGVPISEAVRLGSDHIRRGYIRDLENQGLTKTSIGIVTANESVRRGRQTRYGDRLYNKY